MASNLSAGHRARLASIVQQMEQNGEPTENIQTVVDGYKAKYGAKAPVLNPSRAALGTIPGPMSVGFGLGKSLPAIAGAIGGRLAGVPGATAAATLGEAGNQIMEGRGLAPQPPLDFRTMSKRGLEQGAYQLAGTAIGAGAGLVGPTARGTEKVLGNRFARRAIETALPFGGYASHGIPGALAGATLPYVGRAALRMAANPRTTAILNSPAFQEFARQSPRAAAELARHIIDNSPKP